MPSSAGRGGPRPPPMLLGMQDCSPSPQNGLQNQSSSTCFQALFPRHTPTHTHWAITPLGYRLGSISGVNSHARVSSGLPTVLLYLPCLLQQWSRVGTWSQLFRADLAHPSCKVGNRSSLDPSLPEHSYQQFLAAQDYAQVTLLPVALGPQQCCRERTTLLYFASFLFPAKGLWLTWWDTTLALTAIPTLFHGYQWPAVKQLSVWPLQSNASSKLFPSCPNDVPRTYKGYNVRMIILHFSFSLNTLQEEVA